MAASLRASFNSCVSAGQTIGSGIYGLLTNKHAINYWKSSGGRDKALKVACASLDAAREIAKASGASDRTVEGLTKGENLAKAGRDAIAFFNIFAGIIPGLIQQLKNVYYLAKGLWTGEEVRFKPSASDPTQERPTDYIPADTQTESHSTERVLSLGANFFGAISALGYIVGFGVCRPIATLNKYLRDKEGRPLIEMGEGATKLGQAFGTVMFGHHLADISSSGFKFGYDYKAFERGCKEYRRASADYRRARPHHLQNMYNDYKKAVTDNALNVVEKTLELGLDVAVLSGKAAPAWFRCPAAIGIGLIGVYKEWRKTA
jgi:hypothetical protein